MCLTVKTRAAESLDWANCALSACHTNGVDHLVVCEDICHFELLLELAVSVINFLSDAATVDLDLHDVGLVLAEVKLADLGSAEHAHDRTVFFYAGKVALDGILVILRELVTVRVLGESLPLCAHPILVHSALDFSVEVLSPDGGEGTEAARSLDVADESDNLHRRALNDGQSVDNVLLDHLFTFTTLLVLDTVSHSGLVAHEGCQVYGALLDIAGE